MNREMEKEFHKEGKGSRFGDPHGTKIIFRFKERSMRKRGANEVTEIFLGN